MSVAEPPTNRTETAIAGGLFLVLSGTEGRSPAEIGGLLHDLEALHWRCVELSAEVEAARPPIILHRLQLGSPLEIVMDLPPIVWQLGTGFTFVGTLAMIFRLPARFESDRERFWRSRLSADKAKREWVELKEAEYLEKRIRLEEMILPEGIEPPEPPPGHSVREWMPPWGLGGPDPRQGGGSA